MIENANVLVLDTSGNYIAQHRAIRIWCSDYFNPLTTHVDDDIWSYSFGKSEITYMFTHPEDAIMVKMMFPFLK